MIKFYTEKVTDKLIKELIPIWEESKEEVYYNKDDKTLYDNIDLEKLNINFKYYYEKQRENMLHISTVRFNNKLIGYWCLVLMFHNQSVNLLIANCENLHIIKEYRKNNIAKDFIKFTEESLKKRGVKQIYFGVNPQLKTDLLLKRLGYSINEIVMTKGI